MAKLRLKTIACAMGCGAFALLALSSCSKNTDSSLPASTPPTVVPAAGESQPLPTQAVTETEEVLYFGGSPSGLLLLDGTLVLCDGYSKQLWSLPLSGGDATILAGREGVPDLNGVPIGGYNDADAALAAFAEPWDMAEFMGGTAITDTANHVVRILKDSRVYTIAGTGKAGLKDGTGVDTLFHSPTGITTDGEGALYVADTGNHLIRRIDKDGRVTVYAGSREGLADGPALQAAFRSPTGLCWKNGALYVADSGNHRVCVIQDGNVTTLAGPDSAAAFASEEERQHGTHVDGPAENAMFSNPQGVVVAEDGSIFVADTGNGALRRIQNGQVDTLQQGSDKTVYPVSPRGLLLCGNFLYITDTFSGLVYALAIQGL